MQHTYTQLFVEVCIPLCFAKLWIAVSNEFFDSIWQHPYVYQNKDRIQNTYFIQKARTLAHAHTHTHGVIIDREYPFTHLFIQCVCVCILCVLNCTILHTLWTNIIIRHDIFIYPDSYYFFPSSFSFFLNFFSSLFFILCLYGIYLSHSLVHRKTKTHKDAKNNV